MISVIIPTYNERENIEKIIPLINEVLGGYEHEIIVVDDNSPDGTWKVAENLSKQYPVKLLRRMDKRGLATAILDGIEIAKGDIIVVMDADLQHPPRYIPKLIEPILNNEADVVIGSRYVKGGEIGNWSLLRRLISKGATLLSHIAVLKLRGIKDPMSGFFALKKQVIDSAELNPLGYKVLLEILVKGNVSKVKEVPYTFEKRYFGKSKLGSGEIFSYIKHLIRLSLWTGDFWRIMKYIIVGFTGLVVNLLVLFSLVDLGLMSRLLAFLGISLADNINLVFVKMPSSLLLKILSAAISVEISIIWNFNLNNIWTFRNRMKKGLEALKALVKFNIVSVGGILINLTIYTLLLTIFGLYYLLSEAIAVFVAFFWNFIVNDTWTWEFKNDKLAH